MTDTAYGKLVADAYSVRWSLAGTFPWLAALEIAGAGWATVELERAAADLGEELCGSWLPAPREPLLGARAWACDAEPPSRLIRPVLLEPDTEGRLAATLARFGEGVAAIYLMRSPGEPTPPTALSTPAAGPFGPARLLLGGPRWGPSAIVLEPPA